MATWIIGSLVVLTIAVVLYRTFFRKNRAGGCSQCEDIGCPLIDHAKVMQANQQRKA